MSAPITLRARLGADPELRFSAAGKPVVKLSAVTSQRKRMDDNTWQDTDTTWWKITAFGPVAENVAESCTKGTQIVIVGRVKSNEWETPEGEKRTTFEVLADTVAIDLSRVTVKISKVERPSTEYGGNTAGALEDPWAHPAPQLVDPPF